MRLGIDLVKDNEWGRKTGTRCPQRPSWRKRDGRVAEDIASSGRKKKRSAQEIKTESSERVVEGAVTLLGRHLRSLSAGIDAVAAIDRGEGPGRRGVLLRTRRRCPVQRSTRRSLLPSNARVVWSPSAKKVGADEAGPIAGRSRRTVPDIDAAVGAGGDSRPVASNAIAAQSRRVPTSCCRYWQSGYRRSQPGLVVTQPESLNGKRRV